MSSVQTLYTQDSGNCVIELQALVERMTIKR